MSIFNQDIDFQPKFLFSTKISIFDQNVDFWPKFRFLTNISIFDQQYNKYMEPYINTGDIRIFRSLRTGDKF